MGSAGHDVASTLAVDPTSGDVIVCGSTTGDLYEEPGFVYTVGGDVEPEGLGEKGTQPFCVKLAAADGHVRTNHFEAARFTFFAFAILLFNSSSGWVARVSFVGCVLARNTTL